MLLAPGTQRPGGLLHTPECRGQPPTRQTSGPRTSVVRRLRNPGLKREKLPHSPSHAARQPRSPSARRLRLQEEVTLRGQREAGALSLAPGPKHCSFPFSMVTSAECVLAAWTPQNNPRAESHHRHVLQGRERRRREVGPRRQGSTRTSHPGSRLQDPSPSPWC